jgi:2-dehydro-3-deoxyphosphogluconate aldolase / (4S)-4-hydroxy-2-oxoglutarate aldolase
VNIDEVIRKIAEAGIIPVVRAASLEHARKAVDAICEGGIPILEITMTVPDAPAVIREVIGQYGSGVVTGAGTVTTAAQAEICIDAGAEFLVSPGLSAKVLRAAEQRGILAIPGALTPSEIMAAQAEGARLIKIFPCGAAGGPKYIQDLRGPFPDATFIPTGGVSLANASEYIAAGAFALGVGSDLVDAKALHSGNSQKVVDAARAYIAAVRQARAAKG